MAEIETEVMDCPHCGIPFYPNWNNTTLSTSTPSRTRDAFIGRIRLTTCTSVSCGKLIILWEDDKEVTVQLFPIPPEGAIEIIIQIRIDFENHHRRQQGDPEMKPEEEVAAKADLRKKFQAMIDYIKTGNSATIEVLRLLSFLGNS